MKYNTEMTMQAKILTLTTDFGLKDPYVAEMKAVILSIYSNATIIDVTHEIDKFNIKAGAFALASATPFFPDGTIHIAVVDPGVGTTRHPIVVETLQAFYVGPDNGLMILAAESQGIKQVRKIENKKFMLHHVSGTFHGRDIFAPAAAHLANGASLDELGERLIDFVKPSFATVLRTKEALVGEVLQVDDFGNVITNIHARDIEALGADLMRIQVSSKLLLKLRLSKTYSDVDSKMPLALIGSHGYLEIAVNQGSAAAKFLVEVGSKIKILKA